MARGPAALSGKLLRHAGDGLEAVADDRAADGVGADHAGRRLHADLHGLAEIGCLGEAARLAEHVGGVLAAANARFDAPIEPVILPFRLVESLLVLPPRGLPAAADEFEASQNGLLQV